MKNNQKVRILHIDTEKGWRGGQQQAIYLFEKMIEKGFETTLICQPASALQKYCEKKKLPCISIKMENEFDIFAGFKIGRFCRINNFNGIVLHSGHAVSIGLLAKLFSHKIKLIAVRRVDFNIKKNVFSRFKYRTTLLNKIVCISHFIEQVMLSNNIPEDKLCTIHSGIDINKFKDIRKITGLKKQFNIPDDHIVIGTVAALVGHKDYPTLFKAAKIVISINKNITFCAAGSGKDEIKIKKLHEELKLGERFIFTGYLENIGEYLKQLDVFILTSKKEGMGTSILDAQSVGLPVVATKAGGIPEIVQDKINGRLVFPEDPVDLANTILEIAKNKSERVRLGNNALEKVKAFTINKTVERYVHLYHELLNL